MTFSLWSEGACHKSCLKLVTCLRQVGALPVVGQPGAQVFLDPPPLLSLSLPPPASYQIRTIHRRDVVLICACVARSRCLTPQ